MKKLINHAVGIGLGGCFGVGIIIPAAIAQTPPPAEEEAEITITGEVENPTPPIPGNQTTLTIDDIRKQQGGTVRDLLRYEPGISVPIRSAAPLPKPIVLGRWMHC